jgi:hypothetical protein
MSNVCDREAAYGEAMSRHLVEAPRGVGEVVQGNNRCLF